MNAPIFAVDALLTRWEKGGILPTEDTLWDMPEGCELEDDAPLSDVMRFSIVEMVASQMIRLFRDGPLTHTIFVLESKDEEDSTRTSSLLRLQSAIRSIHGHLTKIAEHFAIENGFVDSIWDQISSEIRSRLTQPSIDGLELTPTASAFYDYLWRQCCLFMTDVECRFNQSEDNNKPESQQQNEVNFKALVDTLDCFGILQMDFFKSLLLDLLDRSCAARVKRICELDEDDGILYSPLVPRMEDWCDGVRKFFIQEAQRGKLDSVEFLSQRLSNAAYMSIGRLHISNLFGMIVDFPDSKPLLEDLRDCASKKACGCLSGEIALDVRSVLASRLHHAGTSTEDIITVLISAIRSLCVIFPPKEQGAGVFAAVSETLAHLGSRRDSVPCITKGLTDPSTDESLAKEFMRFANDRDSLSDDDDGNSPEDKAQKTTFLSGGSLSRRYYRRPNVLRVLLSAVSIPSIVKEYRQKLSAALLSRKGFVVDDDERVVERLKCMFGEDVMAECSVMIRDIHRSRRINDNVTERASTLPLSSITSANSSLALPSFPISMRIISRRKWPSLDPQGAFPTQFKPHPILSDAFAAYSALFHQVKPNMRLAMILSQGTVSLSIKHHDPVSGTLCSGVHELNMLISSAILHLKECTGSLSLQDLRELLGIQAGDAAILSKQLLLHHPQFVVFDNVHSTVSLQKYVVRRSGVVEETRPESNPAPDGISVEQISIVTKLTKAMLKTSKTGKPLGVIYNSLKALGSYNGTLTELRDILDYVVNSSGGLSRSGDIFALVK